MARERYLEMSDDENIPADAFRRSQLQYRFNMDRIIDKYQNLEMNGKTTGIEVDLTNGDVYFPSDMPAKEVRKHVCKIDAFEDQFGLGKLSAPCNGREVFGKEYKRRRKECSRLDTVFGELFKSEYPSWRPYTPPKKSRVERTVVKRTVKELTFESSEGYFNYLVQAGQIPLDVFKQQERVGFVHRLALSPVDPQTYGTNMRPGVGPGMLRSRSASPCVPTERKRVPALDVLQPMLLSVDCARSRECSPSHSLLAMDTSAFNGSPSHAELASQSGSFFANTSLEEAVGAGQHSNVELENSPPSVALVESLTPKPPSGTSPVTKSGISSRKRPRRRKGTPLHFEKDTDSRFVGKPEDPSPLKNNTHVGAEEPNPSFGSTNLERIEGKTNEHNEKSFTLTTSKKSAGRTPSPTKASPKSTGTNSRKRKASSHSSAGGRDKHPRKGQDRTPKHLDSTPLCSKTSRNFSSTETKQRSAASGFSKKKSDVSQITPRTASLRRITRSSGGRVVTAVSEKVSADETPRCATARALSAQSMKMRNVIAQFNEENPIETSKSSISVTTPSSGKRTGSCSAKKSNASSKDGEHPKKQGKTRATPVTSSRKAQPRKAQTPSASPVNPQGTHSAKSTPRFEGKRVSQSTLKTTTKTTVKEAKKEPVSAKSSTEQKTGEQPSKTYKNKKKSEDQKKVKETAAPATLALVLQNSPLPSPTQKSSEVKSSGRAKRRSDDSDVERAVTPINGDVVACSIWNENVRSIVRSYDDCVVNCGKMGTIFGFDAGEVRQQCDAAQQSTLSMFVTCARKYQSIDAESSSVDAGLKEDRRAMAAARIRNRQLTSGYYV
ncbi:hypothetical protein ANCCAN_03398 [Ancylostoma caninum]|uniref:Uncharacterized protein n=1 Tax=Ancylostoma caninum TaxID=29170 RepID=A0A368H1R9_ANCCA|nr:hypothetical protein ANCCAN_03398 [Ancylostoma caninum]